MSESDVSDSKHEECGDPAPGPGEARAGVLVVAGRGGYCWLAVLEAAARMGGWSRVCCCCRYATSSVRLHLILAEPGPRPPARQQSHSLELDTDLREV